MAKLTLEELRKMRGEKQKAMEMRDSANKDVQVIVGITRSILLISIKSRALPFRETSR